MKVFDIIYLAIAVVMITGSIIPLVNWCVGITEETSNKDKKQMKQTVYKIDGDFTGDINGDNVTVILMNGNMTGDIKSNNGNVVLIKGNITGDVEANKVMSPHTQSEYEEFTDKLSQITPLRQNEDGETKSKNKLTCEDCKNFQIKNSSYYCSNINCVMRSTVPCSTFFEPQKDYPHCCDCIQCQIMSQDVLTHDGTVVGQFREYWCQYHGIEVDGNSHCEAYTSINSIKNVPTLEPLTKLDYG